MHRRLNRSPGKGAQRQVAISPIITPPKKRLTSKLGAGTFCEAWPAWELNCVPSFVQSSPSNSAVSAPCPQCGQAARLKLVEPHPISDRENHTFQCDECGLPRTYAMARSSASDVGLGEKRPPARSVCRGDTEEVRKKQA